MHLEIVLTCRVVLQDILVIISEVGHLRLVSKYAVCKQVVSPYLCIAVFMHLLLEIFRLMVFWDYLAEFFHQCYEALLVNRHVIVLEEVLADFVNLFEAMS